MGKVGIIDYGSGNFASVYNAVKSISGNIVVVTTKHDLDSCSHIILPGVGAFGAAMERLKSMDIIDSLQENVFQKDKYFLGICVGMQVLAARGTEFGTHTGLGWIKGSVDKIELPKGYVLPHMGWNTLSNLDANPLFLGLDAESTFYFVHSFALRGHGQEGLNVTTANYGLDIVAALVKDNIFGVQFHPEKSQYDGLILLKNFISF